MNKIRKRVSFLLIIILAVVITGCSSEVNNTKLSSGTITGVVKCNETGEFIEGVNIDIGAKKATSNVDGIWKIKDMAVGESNITAKKTGYIDYSDTILVEKGNSTYNFSMEKEVYNLHINTQGKGIIKVNPDKEIYNYGDEIIIRFSSYTSKNDQERTLSNMGYKILDEITVLDAYLVKASNGVPSYKIRDVLNKTAMDLGYAGYDSYYGYGLVNAYWAIINNVDKLKIIIGTLEDDKINAIAKTEISPQGEKSGKFKDSDCLYSQGNIEYELTDNLSLNIALNYLKIIADGTQVQKI